MKTDLKLSDVELTGEYRVPKEGEFILLGNEVLTWKKNHWFATSFPIVRPKAESKKPLISDEGESKPRRWVFESAGEPRKILDGEYFICEGTVKQWRSVTSPYGKYEPLRLVESPEEATAEKPKPVRKLKGEWRFRTTGTKRRATYGDWVACPERGIFFYNDFQPSKEEYEILELIEQPRELVEMPDELVLVKVVRYIPYQGKGKWLIKPLPSQNDEQGE